MSEKNLVPKRRFKEFQNTRAWEQRKLGEMCVIGDIDHRMPDSVRDGIPYLMTGDFIGLNGLDFEKSKKVSIKDYQQLSRKIKPEQGDILFARYASVGTVRYVETLEKFLISYSCAILKPDGTINGKYLFYYLQSDGFQQQIESEINTGSQRNIGIDSLKKLNICVPSMKEQSLISMFLTQLDSQITLHQRKLEKTKALKSAYLAEMFPAEGERVPTRRFKKYVNEWQTINFEQILIVNSGRDYKHLNKGNIPVYGTGGFMLLVDDKLSDVDAIGIGRKGTIDRPQLLKAPFWTVDTLFFLTPIKNIDLYFLYIISQTINWRKMDESTGVPSLSKVAIEKISISIPCLNEQQAIGGFFKKLDDSIANQHHKLSKLKAMKQAYLEEMFV